MAYGTLFENEHILGQFAKEKIRPEYSIDEHGSSGAWSRLDVEMKKENGSLYYPSYEDRMTYIFCLIKEKYRLYQKPDTIALEMRISGYAPKEIRKLVKNGYGGSAPCSISQGCARIIMIDAAFQLRDIKKEISRVKGRENQRIKSNAEKLAILMVDTMTAIQKTKDE